MLGQTALLEAGVALSLAATNGVDTYADYPHVVAAIDAAERIVVTEHSFEYDVDDVKHAKALRDSPIIYETKELNRAQRAAFKAGVSKLDPKLEDVVAACIFEPHHTVTFFRANQEPSVMRSCFECGDIEWDGTNDRGPSLLFGAVGQLVVSVGLQPNRDWRALAKEHLKSPRPK